METTSDEGLELSMYEALTDGDEQGESEEGVPPPPKKSRRRWYISLGSLGVVVAAACLVIFLFNPLNSSDSSDPDKEATKSAYNSLQSEVQSTGKATLDSKIDPHLGTLLKTALDTSSMTLTGAVVNLKEDGSDDPLVPDSQKDEMHVDVSGEMTLYSQPHDARVFLRFVDGEAFLWALLTQKPQPANGAGASVVTLSDWIKDEGLPTELGTLKVTGPSLIVSSQDSVLNAKNVSRGLSILATVPLDDTTNPTPKLDLLRSVVPAAKPALLCGLLKPKCWCPAVHYDTAVNLFKDNQLFSLTNFTTSVVGKAASASAYLHIKPNDGDELLLFLNGTVDLKTSTARLNATQVGVWHVPSLPSSFSLQQFVGQLNVDFKDKKHPAFTGFVQTGVVWGKASGFLRVDMPAKGFKNGSLVLEGRFKDTFQLTDLPEVARLPAGAPTKGLKFTGSVAVLFSTDNGTYTFHDKDAPVPVIGLVDGLNLVTKLDWQHSTSTAMTQFASATGMKDTVLVAGGFANKHRFRMWANVSDVTFADSKVAVKSGNVSFGTDSPYFRFGADFSVNSDFLGTDQPLTALLEGAVTDTIVQADGNVSNVVDFTVGSVPVAIEQMWYNFTWNYKTHKHTDDVRGLAKFGLKTPVEYKAVFEYPGMNSGDVQCPLWELERFALTTVKDVLTNLDISEAELDSLPIPSSVRSAIFDSEVDNVDLQFSVKCETLTLAAFVKGGGGVFGEGATIGFEIQRGCPIGQKCKPMWSFFVVPNKDFDFCKSGLIDPALHFPYVVLEDLLFVLSNTDTTLKIPDLVAQKASLKPTQLKDLQVIKGVQFAGVLIVDGSPELALIRKLNPTATELDVHGDFTLKNFDLYVAVGDINLPKPLGHNVYLTAFDQVLYADWGDKKKTAGTKAHLKLTITLGGENKTFDTWGEIALDHVELSTLMAPEGVEWDLNLLPFTLKNLNLTVIVSWKGGNLELTKGAVGGEIQVGEHTTLAAEVDLWLGSGGGGVTLTASILEDQPLTIGDVLEMVDHALKDALNLPENLEHALDAVWAFESGTLVASTSPLSVNVSGVGTLFEIADIQVVMDIFKDSEKKWQAAIAANLGPTAKPESVFGTKSAFNSSMFPVGLIRVAFTTCDVTIKFPDPTPIKADTPIPTHSVELVNVNDDPPTDQKYKCMQGFNFVAVLSFVNRTGPLLYMNEFLKVDSVEVWGIIASELSFEFHADVTSHINLFEILYFDSAGVFVRVQGEDAQIGVEVGTSLHFKDQDPVVFHGDVYAGELGFGCDLSMDTPWVHPLGIPHLTLDQAALSVEMSWSVFDGEFVPLHIGVKGGAHIDKTGADVAVWIAVDGGEMLDIKIDEIHFQALLDGLLSGLMLPQPPAIVDTLVNMGFNSTEVYANTMSAPIRFGGVTYNPGFKADIQGFNMWNLIKGDAMFEADTKHLMFDATLQPISLLDGKFVVSGAEGPGSSAHLRLSIAASVQAPMATPLLPKANARRRVAIADVLARYKVREHALPVSLDISGGLEFFGQWIDVAIQIDDTKWMVYLNISVIENMFDLVISASTSTDLTDPTDFNFDFEMQNDIQDWVAKEVPKQIELSKNYTDSKIQDFIDDLAQKEADMDDIDAQIAAEEAIWNKTVDKVIADLNKAELDVDEAQRRVDHLQDRINDIQDEIDHLKWYQKWKAIPLGIEIAGLWVAKETADGALDIARIALEAAEKAAEGALPDLDPKLILLRTEKGLQIAALEAAQAALKGVKDVYDHLALLAEDVAKWEGEVFNIEELSVKGGVNELMNGDLTALHVKGIFVGKAVEFDCKIDFKKIESVVGTVWHGILKIFHLDSEASNRVPSHPIVLTPRLRKTPLLESPHF